MPGLYPLWLARSSMEPLRSCLLQPLDSGRRDATRGLKEILKARDIGLKAVRTKAKAGMMLNQNVGPVAWLGIGQRIQYAKQSPGPFMKVHPSVLGWGQKPIKTTTNRPLRRLQSQFASSIKIQESANLGPSAVSFMIRTTVQI